MLAIVAVVFVFCRQKDPDEALSAGLAAQMEGDLEGARGEYEAVLEEQPGNVYANHNLGLIEQQEGNLEAAERYYRAALRTNPNFVRSLFNLAIIRADRGDSQEAEELYRQVLSNDPEHARAHLNLGYLLRRQLNRPEEGAEHLRRAVELDPALSGRVPDGIFDTPSPEVDN